MQLAQVAEVELLAEAQVGLPGGRIAVGVAAHVVDNLVAAHAVDAVVAGRAVHAWSQPGDEIAVQLVELLG